VLWSGRAAEGSDVSALRVRSSSRCWHALQVTMWASRARSFAALNWSAKSCRSSPSEGQLWTTGRLLSGGVLTPNVAKGVRLPASVAHPTIPTVAGGKPEPDFQTVATMTCSTDVWALAI
jgi:hypothetical protein